MPDSCWLNMETKLSERTVLRYHSSKEGGGGGQGCSQKNKKGVSEKP